MTARLVTFLDLVRQGELFIPEFQRPFVWDDARRLALLDSVSRGFPIGTFLLWRTSENPGIRTYKQLGPFPLPAAQPGGTGSFLIDGHQRLTTLYAALRPVTALDLEELQAESGQWPVYFDLAAPSGDAAFRLAPRGRRAVPSFWLPTHILFSPRELWHFQAALSSTGREALAERSEDLANAFKDYVVPVVPLVTNDFGSVIDVFMRINSGGNQLTEEKLFRALTFVNYRLDEGIDALRADLAELGWGALGADAVMMALKVRLGLNLDSDGPAEMDIALRARGDGTRRLAALLKDVGRGLRAGVKVLTRCGFSGPAMLSSVHPLVGLAQALVDWGDEDADGTLLMPAAATMRRIRVWVWAASYTGYFVGMSAPRVVAAFLFLDVLVAGQGTLPEDLPRTVAPLGAFQFEEPRVRAFVMAMADHIADHGLRNRVKSRLGERGAAAVDRIFPEMPDTLLGNRVVTLPKHLQALRAALSERSGTLDPEISANHFIPPEALRALARRPTNLNAFCRIRADYLANCEAEWLAEFGLRPAS